MVTLNNFVDDSVDVLLFSLTQMDEKLKLLSEYFGREGGISLTQYARFPGKI